jgi:hypothetical protein
MKISSASGSRSWRPPSWRRPFSSRRMRSAGRWRWRAAAGGGGGGGGAGAGGGRRPAAGGAGQQQPRRSPHQRRPQRQRQQREQRQRQPQTSTCNRRQAAAAAEGGTTTIIRSRAAAAWARRRGDVRRHRLDGRDGAAELRPGELRRHGYQQCGGTWYQPQGTQFVVVNPPTERRRPRTSRRPYR